jgi:S-DNA-T family DNA segregation ATPase FtsK/SpoIIIE
MAEKFDLKLAQSMVLSTAYKAVKTVSKFISPWSPVATMPGAFGKAISEMPGKVGDGKLWFVVGKDATTGVIAYERLEDMPHLMISGITKSGKSVFLNCLMASLLMRNDSKSLRLGLIDKAKVELGDYAKLPHVIGGVRFTIESAYELIHECTLEMERRINLLLGKGVKNLADYNSKVSDPLPRWVIVIDEFAYLLASARKNKDTKEITALFEAEMSDLAAVARKTGIHLVLCTQKPLVVIVDTLMKSNFPSRVAFKMSCSRDSETALGRTGIAAEKLKGSGDMYFLSAEGGDPFRLQGLWVSDEDIRTVVEGG